MEEKVKICEYCGEPFATKDGRIKFCSDDCRRTVNSSEYNRQKRRKKRERSKSNLAEINAAARAAGMTYGQYVAEEYKKTLRFSHD